MKESKSPDLTKLDVKTFSEKMIEIGNKRKDIRTKTAMDNIARLEDAIINIEIKVALLIKKLEELENK